MTDEDPIEFTACGLQWDRMTPEAQEAFGTMIRLAYEAAKRGDFDGQFERQPVAIARVREAAQQRLRRERGKRWRA